MGWPDVDEQDELRQKSVGVGVGDGMHDMWVDHLLDYNTFHLFVVRHNTLLLDK